MESVVERWLFDPVVGKLIFAVTALIVVYALVRVLQRTTSRYLGDTDARYKTRKAIGFLGYIAAFVLLAGTFSDRFGQLTVAFGVAGAGIAFALQEVIASVAGWVAISFGGFYRTGHRVQVGGIRGDVIDIGVLRTTLMECGDWVRGDLYNGRIVRIANSSVLRDPVFNYSADFPFLWDEIVLGVRYGSDYRLAREIFQKVGEEVVGEYARSAKATWREMVKKYRIEDAAVEPTVSVVANENWLEYTLRYVVDYKLRRSTRDRLFTRILEEVDRSGGRVSIAASSLEISEMPALDVKLGSAGGAPHPEPPAG